MQYQPQTLKDLNELLFDIVFNLKELPVIFESEVNKMTGITSFKIESQMNFYQKIKKIQKGLLTFYEFSKYLAQFGEQSFNECEGTKRKLASTELTLNVISNQLRKLEIHRKSLENQLNSKEKQVLFWKKLNTISPAFAYSGEFDNTSKSLKDKEKQEYRQMEILTLTIADQTESSRIPFYESEQFSSEEHKKFRDVSALQCNIPCLQNSIEFFEGLMDQSFQQYTDNQSIKNISLSTNIFVE